MDTATAIATARKVQKVADKIIKYIKADNEESFGLDEEVSVVLMGDDVTLFQGGGCVEDVTTADGSLTIAPIDNELDWGIRLTAHPFPASSRLWNGPDVIANNQYRSMLASLFHDLIWEHGDELAKAWGVSKQAVLQWGDGVLYALWMYASEDSLRGRIEARVAWSVCEFARGWYHRLKKLLGLHSILFALLLAGCGTPPDWTVAEISGTNAVLRAMGKTTEIAQGEVVPAPAQADESSQHLASASPASSDTVDFASLDWCWGGFNGAKAKPVDGCEIGSLKVTADGLSYKWVKGGCEQLDKNCSHSNPCCTCALFCRVDGKWIGGKWEHISTDRTTRDFKNVKKGYGGWDASVLGKATAYAFVILDDGAKKRTNIIVQEK